MPHLRSARCSPAPPMSPPAFTRAAYDDRAGARARSPTRSTSPPTSSRICRSSRSQLLGDKLRPGTRSLAIAQDRAAEKQLHRIDRRPRRAVARSRSPRRRSRDRRSPSSRLPLVLKTRRYGYDGKGQAWIRSAGRRAARPGTRSAAARRRRGRDRLRRRILGDPRALGGRPTTRSGTRPRNVHRDGILRRSTVPCRRRRRGTGRRSARRSTSRHRRGARPCRRADRRVLRQRRRAGRQRDRAARPQQRPLDDRGRGHLAVRAAHPRDLRPAARLDRADRAAARRWKI